jgi:hypothetical protein
MLEPLELAWRLLTTLPTARYLQLLPWHLAALLFVLGVLAAFGLHHLIGYTFRFYDAGRHRPLLAALTLTVLLASVLTLLLAYLLRSQAEALIRPTLAPEAAAQPASMMGSILLDPAFSDDDLNGESQVSKERLAAIVVALDDSEWRGQLEDFRVAPGRLVLAKAASTFSSPSPASGTVSPPTEDAPAFALRDDLISAIVVQIGLRWLLEAEQTWPQGMAAGSGSLADQRLKLPEFALALLDEIQDDAVLDRLDWEHVAGTRFVQAVLQPVLVESVGRQAAILALLVLAADAAYFVLASRIVGHLRRRAKPKSA